MGYTETRLSASTESGEVMSKKVIIPKSTQLMELAINSPRPHLAAQYQPLEVRKISKTSPGDRNVLNQRAGRQDFSERTISNSLTSLYSSCEPCLVWFFLSPSNATN